MQQVVLVCVSTFFAAALSAVAGGGTFVAFPVLTGVVGLSEKIATMTCTVGLWPGLMSAVVAVWRECVALPRRMIFVYTVVELAGGFLGAELLLDTSERDFHFAIPWLLLFATLVFALGDRISKWTRREAIVLTGAPPSARWTTTVGTVLFVLSIYGGYFGAEMGVLTLAALSLIGLGDIKQINVLKILLVTACNLTAAVVFFFGAVRWNVASPMAVSSIVGGYVGMRTGQQLPPWLLRAVILVSATLLTAVYFRKVYWR